MSSTKSEMLAMLKAFRSEVPSYYSVCSLESPKPECVSFLRSIEYLHLLYTLKSRNIANLVVIAPPNIELPVINGVTYYLSDYVDVLFTLYNNEIRKNEDPSAYDQIHPSVILDKGAVIGAEGASIANYKDQRVLFRHYGRVVLQDNVYIGANAVIQRGRIDETVIGKGSVISSLCVVGANSHIGENCTLTIQSGVSGSCILGNRVWLGIGAKVRNSVSICDDAFIGMGSVVTKDITEPGVYIGNPCRFLRPHSVK